MAAEPGTDAIVYNTGSGEEQAANTVRRRIERSW
jgi:hypothetical protein